MKNVTAKIVFALNDETGKEIHKTELVYNGMDEEQVLFLESHMLKALSGMNAEATTWVQEKNKGKGGK